MRTTECSVSIKTSNLLHNFVEFVVEKDKLCYLALCVLPVLHFYSNTETLHVGSAPFLRTTSAEQKRNYLTSSSELLQNSQSLHN